MNIALWIVQIILALLFLLAGITKSSQPLEKLQTMMPWVSSMNPPVLVRVIGVLEALAAIGLILPAVTGILPILTPLAAAGLVLTMIGAMLLHIRRGDPAGTIITNLVLLLLAAFVAYGRFVIAPIS